jgi:hypothetical protein
MLKLIFSRPDYIPAQPGVDRPKIDTCHLQPRLIIIGFFDIAIE